MILIKRTVFTERHFSKATVTQHSTRIRRNEKPESKIRATNKTRQARDMGHGECLPTPKASPSWTQFLRVACDGNTLF